MIFRSLSKNDSCLIAQLFSQSFSDGWTKEMLVSGFETGGLKAIGAFDGEQMVGVITYSIGVDFADIEDVVVQKTFRRKGIASALVEMAIEDAFNGVKKIFLEVRQSNEGAINLYKKKGFNQISIRKKYYEDGENALIFVKEK